MDTPAYTPVMYKDTDVDKKWTSEVKLKSCDTTQKHMLCHNKADTPKGQMPLLTPYRVDDDSVDPLVLLNEMDEKDQIMHEMQTKIDLLEARLQETTLSPITTNGRRSNGVFNDANH